MSTPTSAVTIFSRQSISNGAIVIVLRVNGDPTSDWPATVYLQKPDGTFLTTAEVQSLVEDEKTKAAAQYDAMQAAHSTLAAIT